MSRLDLIEKFKANLNQIGAKKVEIESLLLNGADQVREHCLELRIDVDLATETAIAELQKHRDAIIMQINDYEAETVALVQIEKNTRDEFERSIRSMAEFTGEWKSYLEKAEVDEKEVAVKNELALELIMKADWEKEKLTSIVFNKKMIMFMKNVNEVEMGNIGIVKFKSIGGIDLNEFRQIDIKDVLNIGNCVRVEVQIYPQDDGTFCLLYISACGYGLNQVSINKDKKIVSALKTYDAHIRCYSFKMHKNNIFINSSSGACFKLSKLDRQLSVIKTVDVYYASSFLSASDTHVYSLDKVNDKLWIYNNDLVFLKTVGQYNNLKGPFYLPPEIKQLEVNKGKFYWLNHTKLQILREDSGELVKSLAVTANNFIIDSKDNIVLVNNVNQEINKFDEDGTLIKKVPKDNYAAGLRVALTKDDEPLFYSNSTTFLNNEFLITNNLFC